MQEQQIIPGFFAEASQLPRTCQICGGAAVFVVLQDYISSITVNWMSFVGAIFVLVVLFFPRGLLGMRRVRSSE